MSEIQKIVGSPAIFAPPTNDFERISPAPAEHLLEADVVTNNVPRLTVGRQAQVGAHIQLGRLRDSRELSRSRRAGSRTAAGKSAFSHPLLPDPEDHHDFHDIAPAEITPEHPNEVKALVALAIQGLHPRQQADILRAFQAMNTVPARRSAATERAAPTGRARIRAPGARPIVGHDNGLATDNRPAIPDLDAVDVGATRYHTLAPTLQSQGADPLLALMERQRTADNTVQLSHHMTTLAERGPLPGINLARTPLEHVMHQANSMSERENRLNQFIKANSKNDIDEQRQAAQFRKTREIDPLPHSTLDSLIREVGQLRNPVARESEIVALLDKVQPSQPGLIRALAVQLSTVKDPQLQQRGFARLQSLLGVKNASNG